MASGQHRHRAGCWLWLPQAVGARSDGTTSNAARACRIVRLVRIVSVLEIVGWRYKQVKATGGVVWSGDAGERHWGSAHAHGRGYVQHAKG